MVPRTFPSSLHPFTGRRQLVALFLDSVAGLQRWVDYIPVNFGKGTTLVEGSYNNNGFIAIQEISSGIGLQAFLDYIPVFFDAGATDTWNISAVGFIPYGISGVTSPPSLELSFTRSQTIDPRITFTRASTATRFNASGILVSEAIDGPRFDYDPVTLRPKGLLIEEQRTNLALYSQDLTNAAWVKSNITAAQTATGPDGVANGSTTITASANNGTILQTITSASAARATSCWVKRKTGSGAVEMTQNNGTTWAAVTVTSAWTRVSIASATVTNPVVGFRLVTSGDEIYVGGFQLETGNFPTSYIPTTTAAATRAGDIAVMTGTNFSDWYNASEGTFYAQFTPATSDYLSNKNLFLASDNTTSNLNGLRYITSGSRSGFGVTTTGVAQASISTGAMVANTTYKMAGAYKLNDFAATRNGETVLVDTSGTIPTVTRAEIGTLAGLNIGTQHILALSYYPRRLTNTELQALTS